MGLTGCLSDSGWRFKSYSSILSSNKSIFTCSARDTAGAGSAGKKCDIHGHTWGGGIARAPSIEPYNRMVEITYAGSILDTPEYFIRCHTSTDAVSTSMELLFPIKKERSILPV